VVGVVGMARAVYRNDGISDDTKNGSSWRACRTCSSGGIPIASSPARVAINIRHRAGTTDTIIYSACYAYGRVPSARAVEGILVNLRHKERGSVRAPSPDL
jgi:hypothetical protein